MTQNDNTAIRGAFFGILVLFGIFILGSWFFDSFTGRSLNAEEKVLNIAVYPPGLPDSQWGIPKHGLKLKLSFDPPAPSQFIDTSINVQFENISDDTIAFLYDPNEILKSVSAKNKDKWKLKLAPVPKDFTISDDKTRRNI